MQRLILFIFLFANSMMVCAGNELTEIEKYSSLGKIWGFLKYYHPKVASGKWDWDLELFKKIEEVDRITNKEDLNDLYLRWIRGLGKVSLCKNCKEIVPDSVKKFNLSFSWMKDSLLLSPEVREALELIRINKRFKKNHYVTLFPFINVPRFERENSYKEVKDPAQKYRLLCLFRYWNVIEYYYPYRYLTDQDWESVLPEMIPYFLGATDSINYQKAILKLAAKTNDSHTATQFHVYENCLGKYWPAFQVSPINGKYVITDFINDSLAQKDDIQKGDILLSIDSIPIEEKTAEMKQYISVSNQSTGWRDLRFYALNGNSDSVWITFQRGGGVIRSKLINRYMRMDMNIRHHPPDPKKAYQKPDPGIAYLNLSILTRKELIKAIDSLKASKGIICDMRAYPYPWATDARYEICDKLGVERKSFCVFTAPDPKHPGSFRYNSFSLLTKCGKKNKKPYVGKIVVLINEHTISSPEFNTMALQTLPGAVLIGSTTSGTDGGITRIPLPGGYKVWMSGQGIYYPDGGQTQRTGIRPDITVMPTVDDVIARKDPALQRAIEYINSGK